MSCNKCNVVICENDATVKCSECTKKYHVSCTKIRTAAKLASMAGKDAWICDVCKASDSDNSERGTTVFKAISNLQQQLTAKLDANLTEIKAIKEVVNLTNDKLADMQRSIHKVEQDNVRLTSECENLQKQNTKLSNDLWEVQQEMRDLQQYSRINNIEISGIPLTHGEDVYNVLESVTNALKVSYIRGDISVAHRLRANKQKRDPAIIVSFISRSTKDLWLQAARNKRGLKTSELHPYFTNTKVADVFINEHLTASNKYLLSYGKKLVRDRKLSAVWVRNCKIWVCGMTGGRVYRVWTVQDIDRIVQDTEGLNRS